MLPALLIHIRHGETDWNAARRLQGWQDIPLNAHGRGQAHRNGEVLREFFADRDLSPGAFDWVASPLARASETMAIVRAGVGLPAAGYRLEDDLREISYGIHEGRTHAEIARDFPVDYHQLLTDKWNFRPAGGESYRDLRARVDGVLRRLTRNTVIVSHGGILRMLRAILEDSDHPTLVEFVVPQDQFFVWENGRGLWV